MGYTIDVSQPVWRVVLSGTLTNDDLHRMRKETADIETSVPVVANRLVDLRQLEAINIGFFEINDLAAFRRTMTLPNKIKSALLTNNPVQYGFARMFQTLLQHPQITVELFSDEKEALDWLSK